MKKLILFAAISIGISADAQINLSNSIFPVAGDTLVRSETFSIGAATVTAASGTAQTWDFSYLTTDATLYDSIRDASLGMAFSDFPNTEIILPILGFGNGYVDVDTNAMTMVGAALDLFGMNFTAPFSDPQTLQTAPLNYGSVLSDNHSLKFAQHIDSVPGLRQLVDQLGLPISPDSIRLNIDGSTDLFVDAFGTVMLFDSTYSVLRQKVEVINEVKIEAYVAAFGGGFWLDVTSSVSGILPFPLNDTTFRYDFWADGYKIPVARFNMDGSGNTINSIEFKGFNPNTSVYNHSNFKNIDIFPNPSTAFLNIKTDISLNYNAVIVDGMGRVIIEINNLNGNINQLDITDLPKGNFFLILRSENGELLSTKKFIKH